MKIPRVSEGEDPAAIVSFEMEMMILPRLTGPHVPHCYGTGDFAHQAYAVIERIAGTTLYKRLPDLPLPYDEARLLVAKIATALADLHRTLRHITRHRRGQRVARVVDVRIAHLRGSGEHVRMVGDAGVCRERTVRREFLLGCIECGLRGAVAAREYAARAEPETPHDDQRDDDGRTLRSL